MRSNQSQMVLTELMGAKANQSVGLALRRVLFTGLYVTVNKATPTHTHYKPTCQTNITVTYMMLAIFPTQHCNQNAKSPPNPSHTHHQSPRIRHLVIRAKICLINERTKKKKSWKKKRKNQETNQERQTKKKKTKWVRDTVQQDVCRVHQVMSLENINHIKIWHLYDI